MTRKTIRRFAILLCVLVSVGSAFGQSTKEGIDKVRADWMESFNSKNLAKLMSLYADDAAVMPPTGQRLVGKEDITKYYKQLFDSVSALNIAASSEVTNAANPLGYDSGTYKQTLERAGTRISGNVVISGSVLIQGGGSRAVSTGSYLVVLRYEAHKWLIVQQASTELPERAADTR